MIQQTYAVQRVEERIDMRVTALLVGKHDKLGVETGETADISSRGARVIARSERPAGDTLLIAIPGFQFTAAARVAYCNPLREGRFGIGLEFVIGSEPLEVAALAAELHYSRS